MRRERRRTSCGEIALIILLAFLLVGFFGGYWQPDYDHPVDPNAIRSTLRDQTGVEITMPGDDR